ncbi:unnamed protein product [Nippostrongylus brasiliensis]|uniref:Galectin n=1 Tax=Nippostrongylus brasiliensis TaxID=27835 RepID=A0A0N4Y0M3_NIPBR|nr:unnamed protein product [Nippostrongylus brasiliensis]
MSPGSVLHVHGKINNPAFRVDIDFLEGYAGSAGGKTVFQLSLKFDDSSMVMNSKINGFWGKEEKVTMPFKAGMPFDVKARATSECWEVYCANTKLHTYAHRVPFGPIDIIDVNGEAVLNDQHLILFGYAFGDSWQVELTDNGGNVIFQFVANYKQKSVTRNANIGGNWGQEERGGQFPFQRDRGFDLSIANLPAGIQMIANNARFGTFAHRTPNPISDYTGLKISGDVNMVMVRIA